jgi:hypothetical protein
MPGPLNCQESLLQPPKSAGKSYIPLRGAILTNQKNQNQLREDSLFIQGGYRNNESILKTFDVL